MFDEGLQISPNCIPAGEYVQDTRKICRLCWNSHHARSCQALHWCRVKYLVFYISLAESPSHMTDKNIFLNWAFLCILLINICKHKLKMKHILFFSVHIPILFITKRKVKRLSYNEYIKYKMTKKLNIKLLINVHALSKYRMKTQCCISCMDIPTLRYAVSV